MDFLELLTLGQKTRIRTLIWHTYVLKCDRAITLVNVIIISRAYRIDLTGLVMYSLRSYVHVTDLIMYV